MGRNRKFHPRIDLNEFFVEARDRRRNVPDDLFAVHRLAGNGQWARVFLLEIETPPLAIVAHTHMGEYIAYVAKCKCAPVCDVRMKALAYATERYQSAAVLELKAAK